MLKTLTSTLFALILCSAAQAGTNLPVRGTTHQLSPSAVQTPEVANKKGSKRVGGSNSKGKGSRYVGGRKGKK